MTFLHEGIIADFLYSPPPRGGVRGGVRSRMPKLINDHSTKELRSDLRRRMPPAETMLWQAISRRQVLGKKFRRQVSIGAYVVDFYCPEIKLIIELDGDSHFIDEGQEKDIRRDAFLSGNGFKILRFTNTEIYDNLEQVVERITDAIENTSPAPPRGGGDSTYIS